MQGRISTALLLITSAIALLIAYGHLPGGAATSLRAAEQASTKIIAMEGGENPGQPLRIDLTLESPREKEFDVLIRVTNQSARSVRITKVTSWPRYTSWGWTGYIIGPDCPYTVTAVPGPGPLPPRKTDTIVLAPGATHEARVELNEEFMGCFNHTKGKPLPDSPGTYQMTLIYYHGRPGMGQDLSLPSSRSRTLVWTVTPTGSVTLPPAVSTPTR